MNIKQLTGYEITLLFSTVAYLLDKENLISKTFPAEFINNSYNRINKEQKEGIFRMINSYNKIYGEQILPEWQKLGCLLDDNSKIEFIIENNKIECFKWKDKYYPVATYLQAPEKELPLDEKFIKI